MNKLLIMRLSALGDVAMTVPVIDSLARQYPELQVTVLTANRCKEFFDWMPQNVSVKTINVKDYNGWSGLNKLYREVSDVNYDAVADLHDVLRTKFLKWRFRMAGKKVAVINKGYAEKRALIAHGNNSRQLKSTFERYLDTFRDLGLNVIPDFNNILNNKKKEDFSQVFKVTGEKLPSERWVGIAPFATYEGKIFPLDRMKLVAKILAERGCKVFLFGAGKKEEEEVKTWERDGVMSVIGKLGGFHNELLLMSKLDCMISMDSANMHLASMVATPVVSVWGATHPKAGFLGWKQKNMYTVQLDLRCRPCSIYGNKPCQYGDYRCMHFLPKEKILRHVYRVLGMEDVLMEDSMTDKNKAKTS